MRKTLILLLLVILTSGCGPISIPVIGPTATTTGIQVPTATPLIPTPTTDLPSPTPTLPPVATDTPASTATPTPTPIPIAGLDILLSDDFSNPMSGWDLKPSELDWNYRCYHEAQYLNDEMVLNVADDRECSAARPHLMFDNFILEVTSRWSGGAIGGRYGALFRYQDEDNYYGFYLRNNGRYEIGKRANGEWILVVEDFSDAIDRTGAPNRIHIEAQDRTLVFYVNGQFINAIHDVEHSVGDIVLYAYAPEGAEFFEASFDDIVITKHP